MKKKMMNLSSKVKDLFLSLKGKERIKKKKEKIKKYKRNFSIQLRRKCPRPPQRDKRLSLLLKSHQRYHRSLGLTLVQPLHRQVCLR